MEIQSYYENRLLALRAGHKIAEIEVYLRNMLDFCLNKLEGKDWIKTPRSLALIKEKGKIPLQDKTPSQILSSLMLGELVSLINLYKIEHYMFDLRDMDFKKYHWSASLKSMAKRLSSPMFQKSRLFLISSEI